MQEYTREIPPWRWNVQLTGREMYRLSRQYAADALPYIGLSLEEYYTVVKNIPYKRDPDGEEYLSRANAVYWRVGRGLDCDQKAIAIGSYAELRHIPYLYIAVGRQASGPLRHVLPILYIGGKWQPVDATYPHSTIFKWAFPYQKKVVLRPPW